MTWRQGVIQCEKALREGAQRCLGDCHFLLLEEACTLEGERPLLRCEDFSLYTMEAGRTAVLFHPCGVYVAALAVKRDQDALVSSCLALLAPLAPDFGEHPDLFLSDNPALAGVACLYIRREGLAHARMRRLAEELMDAGEPVHVYEDQEGVSLLWADQKNEADLPRRCEQILLRFGARAGFSGPYDLTISARGLMTKAALAAEGAEGAGLISFASVRWTMLWQQADRILEHSGHAPAEFCHPAIARMVRSDREQGTDYLNSLSAYLRSGRRLREAASQLGVHRNTLDYRVRRASALFDADTDDASTCFELLFSIHLLERYGDRALPLPVEKGYSLPQVQSFLWAGLEGRTIPAGAGGVCRLLLINTSGQKEDSLRNALQKARAAFPGSATAFGDDAVCLALPESAESDALDGARQLLGETELSGLLTPLMPLEEIGRRLSLLRLFLPTLRTLVAPGGVLPVQEHLSDLFFLLLQSRASLSPFYCDEVIRVMDMDYEKNSDLSGSLYVYLTHFMDMAAASAAARIHRNTLEYHLKKIMPLIGGMPGERLRFEMICTYRMLLMSDTDRVS